MGTLPTPGFSPFPHALLLSWPTPCIYKRDEKSSFLSRWSQLLLSSSHVQLYSGYLALRAGYLLKVTMLTFKDDKDDTLRSLLAAYSCRSRGFSDSGKRPVDRI